VAHVESPMLLEAQKAILEDDTDKEEPEDI
jgi:hypothetical protein